MLAKHAFEEGVPVALAKAVVRIESGGKRLCDAEIMLRIMPFPAPDLERAMRERAADIGLNEILAAQPSAQGATS